jgi:ABC-type oligopeptide transport system ATPase subunit
MSQGREVLLQVDHLCQYFGKNRAVDDVTFEIYRGEVFGLVGESGCGKTTTGRCIMGLYPITSGQILFGGRPIVAGRPGGEKGIQMIFQDPMASLDPRMTVREIIGEGLIIGGLRDRGELERRVSEMLELVGLRREYADRYPHEFSGGQRQRIGIARAIIMNPELLIADEPISALDVSIQAQVMNLLSELREKMNLTVLFIAHDLSVVKYFSDRIGVMYMGKLVELAPSEELFAHPLHPYTKSLLSAIPLPDPRSERRRVRIPYDPKQAHLDSEESPRLQAISPGHLVYCNRAEAGWYRKELEEKPAN